MVDDDHAPDRRTVLRNIAAGSAAAVGLGLSAGGASADPGTRSSATAEAFAQYGDRETVEGLFERQGRALAAELAERGYLPAAANPVESVVPLHEYGDDGLATVTTGTRDGTEVIDVRVRQATDGATIDYHLDPEGGDGYALVYPDEGDEGTVVFADGRTGTFSTASTCCPCYDSSCGDTRCTTDQCDSECTDPRYNNYVYYYEERKCCVELSDGENVYCDCYWERTGCSCREQVPDYVCP